MSATAELSRHDDPPTPPDGQRRRRRIVLAVAGVVVLAVVATWLVAFSSAFGVRSVSVRGTHLLTHSQVQVAAHIAHGTPLVRLDTAAAAGRVDKLPEVASAQVSTSFPSTVVITVVERTPVGYVVIGDRTTLVDRTGAQYRGVASPPAGLPKLVVPTDADPTNAGRGVATVAASLPADLRSRVRSIEALDPSAITLVLNGAGGGKLVRWGTSARSADKARVVDVLRHRKGNHIDVTDPDQPFTR